MNAQDLKKHKWKNRVILIHATNESLIKEQIAEFEQSKEDLKERKIVIYYFYNDHYKMIDYQDQSKSNLLPISNKKHRNTLQSGKDFKLILIGLDGGKKLKKSEPITISELTDKIDSMPMRRAEKRN